MKYSLQQKGSAAEEIAILLYEIAADPFIPLAQKDNAIDAIADFAAAMAKRAVRAKKDKSWWKVAGRPYFNEHMSRLKKRIAELKV